jgi:hypothetical protein
MPYNCVNKRFGAFLSTFMSAIHPSPCRARLLLLSCEGEFEGIIQPHFKGVPCIDILSSGQTKPKSSDYHTGEHPAAASFSSNPAYLPWQ